jgi:hypothetical protein
MTGMTTSTDPAPYAVGYNPADTPVTIDAAGRTVGGLDWGPVDTRLTRVSTLVEAGALYVYPLEALDSRKSDSPLAEAAADAIAAARAANDADRARAAAAAAALTEARSSEDTAGDLEQADDDTAPAPADEPTAGEPADPPTAARRRTSRSS